MSPTPEQVAALVYDQQGFVWLDGPGRSILVFDPVDEAADGDWVHAGRQLAVPSGPLEDGGVFGFIGYGAGHWVDAVPPEATTPEGTYWLGRYDGAMVFEAGRWRVGGSPAFRRKADSLLSRAVPLPPVPRSDCGPAHTVDPATWMQSVERIRQLLHAGDAYQVNLTRPVWVASPPPAWEVYRRLRQAEAAYGAWLRLEGATVLCNSPELLLHVQGRELMSDPIKGTRPRGSTPQEDEAFAHALLLAAKDHAELTMIVDLVRNDLGRVSVAGSVHTHPRRLTSHPNVHHTCQRVTGHLAPGRDAFDAIAALFPPGSVTGAPKVRATQRIAELEAHPRGVYCGAIGFVAGDEAVMNVAIRTAVHEGATARYHVGGGIVLDSDPKAEWDETVDKGRVLANAFGHGPV